MTVLWGLDTLNLSSLHLFLPAPTVLLFFFFSAFLAGFWGNGQTPAYWLEMNEFQGTHRLGGVSSEKLSISGVILLCWPGPEPCPVAYVALLSSL